MQTYDVIVIGTGGIGSAAAFHLAERGIRVLGLDRFPCGHDRGSSHGHTRMIRQAYCEHPDYVPLVQRSFELWGKLEERCGRKLYEEVGLIEVGPPDGEVVPGVLQSAEQHDLPIDRLSEQDVAERFPGFGLPPETTAVFEQRAGYLLVDDCVRTHQEQAAQLGATLLSGHAVQSWSSENGHLVVQTDQDRFAADRLIVTAGPWASELLGDLNVPLSVLRKPQNWFATDDTRYMAKHGCPAFLFEMPDEIFYGFPATGSHGVKVGTHLDVVQVSDPLNVDRNVDMQQRARVEQFLKGCLPGVKGPAIDHSVCLYTMSPDGHFLVDRHPQDERISFVAGLSGHGYKFAPVLGAALADLALRGKTSLPIGFLNCNRFA